MSVIEFPGETTKEIPVDKVCEAAKDCDDVLIIGWKNDDLYIASSDSSVGEAIIKLELAKHMMVQSIT